MNAYPRFVQHVLLPAVSVCTDSRFWSLYQSLSHTEACDPSNAVLQQKLADLLHHVSDRVAFYRDRLPHALTRSHHNPANFLSIPLTTKTDISANFPDRITDSSQQFRPWRYRATSGTIERLTVIHDARKRDAVRAADLLGLKFAAGYQPGMRFLEIPPDVCRNVCGASQGPEPPIHRFFLDNLKAGRITEPEVISDLRGLAERQLIWRKMTLASFGASSLAHPPEYFNQYLDQITAYQPFVVKGLAVYLYLLALHIRQNNSKPPQIHGSILPMGSSLTAHMKRTIEEAFQVPVHEDYGCAELGCIGSECGHGNGIHPFTALFHVEVLREGRPALAGELGKVVITDLNSYAMPFLRYEIGDVAVVRNGRCGCGLDGPRLEVKGRLQDCLIDASGSLITPDDMTDAILACPGVQLFQLELRRQNQVELKIMPLPGLTPDPAQIQNRISDLLGYRPNFSYRLVQTIRPEQGGKYRLVKNHLQVTV